MKNLKIAFIYSVLFAFYSFNSFAQGVEEVNRERPVIDVVAEMKELPEYATQKEEQSSETGERPSDIDSSSENEVEALRSANLNNTIRDIDLKIEKLKIVPNPANNFVEINFEDTHASSLGVYALTGEELFFTSSDFNKNVRIDLASYAPGIYIVAIQNPKEVAIKKLMIKR